MGISVMLFAYGPAVFFLFVERWKRIHPRRGAPGIGSEDNPADFSSAGQSYSGSDQD
jgi:hypothetical protein